MVLKEFQGRHARDSVANCSRLVREIDLLGKTFHCVPRALDLIDVKTDGGMCVVEVQVVLTTSKTETTSEAFRWADRRRFFHGVQAKGSVMSSSRKVRGRLGVNSTENGYGG